MDQQIHGLTGPGSTVQAAAAGVMECFLLSTSQSRSDCHGLSVAADHVHPFMAITHHLLTASI